MSIRPAARPARLALASLAAAVLVGLAPASAGAATTQVGMMPAAFSPQDVTVGRGDRVRWKNTSPIEHDVKATNPAGYFKSGPRGGMDPDDTYAFTFRSAGTFSYLCRLHEDWGMFGTVTVPIRVVELADPVRFKVIVAGEPADSPFRHVIQVKRPGSSAWQTIATTAGVSATLQPQAHGTYRFRSKLLNTATDKSSLWSPVRSKDH